MSNSDAMANITATIKKIVEVAVQDKIDGATVTTVRPDSSGKGLPEVGVNVYLLNFTTNPAYQNTDLARRSKADKTKRNKIGFDLNYLFTFHGNDAKLEPQRLAAATICTMIDNATLTREMINEPLNDPEYSYLSGSNLDQQGETVTITPSVTDLEELGKIWSTLFQCPFNLCFTMKATALLLDGNSPNGKPLPVRKNVFYSTPNQPKLSQVFSDRGAKQPIIKTSALTIYGTLLEASGVLVKIGDAKLTPQEITAQEIHVDLASLPTEQQRELRAGVQSLQVVYPVQATAKYEPQQFMGSNVLPFVLCPTVSQLLASDVKRNIDGLYSARITVEVDVTVGASQRTLIFLNERSGSKTGAYIFNANSSSIDTNVITFNIDNVKPGDYLVRVQIDGAESPLEVDMQPDSETYEQYIRPTITIG